ncbi:MAG: response regulator transcription factor [Meiothermus sp.]|nr:response regulator transcription factor [Meiothermus sp.]
MRHVLLVEDQTDIADSLAGFLRLTGYRVSHAPDGLKALELFFAHQPDLLLLDIMLPGLTGLEVLRTVRGEGQTPVVILTARADEREILKGFDLGADDYITKPFRLREVGARLEAVLRRAAPKNPALQGPNGLTLSLEGRTAQIGESRVELTGAEFDLMAAFLQAPGKVFSRAELLERISGHDRDTLERTVDTHIKNLRRKLGQGHGLETVFGVGYRYDG